MKRHKKNKISPKIILIGLVCLCLVFIGVSYRSGGNASFLQRTIGTIMMPMQKGINSIGQWAASRVEHSDNIDSLEAENAELQKQITILQTQIHTLESNQTELQTLRELLALSEKYPNYNMVGARIIGKDAGNWYNTFIIDKGSLDGIAVDHNVIAGNGLVGIVTEVGANYAKIRSIIDDASNVSAMITNTMDLCIVNGDLRLIDSGLLNVELISKDANILDGDEVSTSYVSDKYLPGLLIGYISNVETDDSNLTLNAKITPVVDFQHLSEVLVITQLKSDFMSEVSE